MKVNMIVTAFHIIDNLGSGLYEGPGQCIGELLRNSLVNSMPPDKWDPKAPRIEIMLVDDHPLCKRRKDKALIVLDHGSGLTEPKLERFFTWLGTRAADLKKMNAGNGASQKGIGRFAALALNSNCIPGDIEECINHGFYVFSRTGGSGQVRFVQFIPRKVEEEGGVDTTRFIAANATELGPFKNIVGSFTAIVIPTPVFETVSEVEEALAYQLPREQDKMYSLTVNGKKIVPPPGENTINKISSCGQFRARIGVLKDGDTDISKGGIWLCDSETGLRVGSCASLHSVLPDPIFYPELVGDIFAPRLLRYQNTARSSLAKEFLRNKSNKDWQRLYMFLMSEVAPAAKTLINRDAIRGDAADTLNELVELFNEQFGPPEKFFGPPKRPEEVLIVPPKKEPGGTPPPPTTPPGPDEHRSQRYVSIKVGENTYQLYRGRSLPPFIFAQLDNQNPKQIFVNVRGGYRALPDTKPARMEHCMMQILQAIAQQEKRNSFLATQYANEIRAQLNRKKK